MLFIKLHSYTPIVDDYSIPLDYFPPHPDSEEEGDDMDELIRRTAAGVVDMTGDEGPVGEEDDTELEITERDVEDLKTFTYLLNLSDDNILYIRESEDLRNPGTLICFVTGGVTYVTEPWQEVLMMISEATGEKYLIELL